MKPLTVIVQLIDVATSCLTDIYHRSRRRGADQSEALPVYPQTPMDHAMRALLQILTIQYSKYACVVKYLSSFIDCT